MDVLIGLHHVQKWLHKSNVKLVLKIIKLNVFGVLINVVQLIVQMHKKLYIQTIFNVQNIKKIVS